MNPLISVVIPVYNMGRALEQCVASLLRQDYEPFEILLIDDGSQDDSLAVCRELARKSPRIRVCHTENRGAGPARNLGMREARGEYLYFPDADDALEPNGLAAMAAAAEGGCDLVVFGFRSAERGGRVIKEKRYPDAVRSGAELRASYAQCMDMSDPWAIQGAPWNKLFQKRLIERHGIEFPPLRRHQDEGFISRYMCHAQRVHFIPDVLYTYYTNDLRREWDKYPVSYIEDVNGLYEIRKQTILTWNAEDRETRAFVERSYLYGFIKALELSFSPKMGFDARERLDWVSAQIERYRFRSLDKAVDLARYQRLVCRLLDRGALRAALGVMQIKVLAEKTGAVSMIKSYRR